MDNLTGKSAFLKTMLMTSMLGGLADSLGDNPFKIEPRDSGGGLSNNWNGARRSEDYKFNKDGVAEKLIDVGRNEPCLCGSGKKYKKCCLK